MRPQSMKIKNMAALLESQMKHNEKKIIEENNNIEDNNDNGKEPFDHMTNLLRNSESKILNKKKMTKKIFED